MKIQCDVCDKEEASVYCTADEAALCHGCDHRVHHANKLASKHHRFSLLSPKPKQLPLCDICQEKRALLFCQQDRAILCQDCDTPIHSASELTKKHDRFLLTGVKLSPTSAVYTCATATADESDAVPDLASPAVAPPSNKQQKAAAEKRSEFEGGSFTSSSISEYLMETLPGWHFEDLLCDSLSPSSGTFVYKSDESGLKYCHSEEEESLGLWVPPQYQTQTPPMYMESSSIINNSNILLPPGNKRWWTQRNDDVFAVPEIMSPPSSSSPTAPRFKRSRHFH